MQVKSTWAQPVMYVAVFTVSFLLVLFWRQSSFSKETTAEKNTVHFKGNEIELGRIKVIPFNYHKTLEMQKKMFLYSTLPDSVPVENWTTRLIKMERVKSDTMPVAINNKPVLGNEPQYLLPETAKKYSPPVFGEADNNFEKYIFQQATNELDKLEDGTYILRVDRLVIDDEGKVAYYQPGGIELFMGSNESKPAIREDTRMAINRKLASILDGPVTFKPAVKDGKPVNVRMSLTKYAIEVKNHKSKLVGRGGC